MIKLHNITLAPEYDSNLISLGQLCKSGMTYHDNPTTMILMKDKNIIAEAKKKQNLFTLDLADLGKAMAIISPQSKASSSKSKQLALAMTKHGRLTHLVSQNKRIQL